MIIFFNTGVTWAILNASGNFPSACERYMIFVFDLPRISAWYELDMGLEGSGQLGEWERVSEFGIAWTLRKYIFS